MIKFSIITVVKNNRKKILQTIESVNQQTFRSFEHIVIDGKSDDGTTELIKNNLNKKIIFFSERDKNLYDGINKGVKIAKGEYIFILNSGDYFYNNLVLGSVNKLAKIRNFNLVVGNIAYFNDKKKITRIWKKSIDKINIMNIYKIPHTGTFISRKTYKILGKYNIKYFISSDTDFLLRLLKLKKINFIYLNKFIVLMRDGGLSTSKKNFLNKFNEDFTIYTKKYGPLSIIFLFFKIFSKLFDFLILNKKSINTFKKMNEK